MPITDRTLNSHVIQEQQLRTERGAILYDASLLGKCGVTATHELFTQSFWRARESLRVTPGGRGDIAVVGCAQERWVLRHYRRGGLVARFNRDQYLWSGLDSTRSFAEWRLLAQLAQWELPVPEPVAANFIRNGMWYRADLLTRMIDDSVTLATQIRDATVEEETWRAVGATIARFHARGVHHADLNAHNILVRAQGAIYILDFDRGRIESRGRWEQRVLERLHRSLRKISLQRQTLFDENQWPLLMDAYAQALQRL